MGMHTSALDLLVGIGFKPLQRIVLSLEENSGHQLLYSIFSRIFWPLRYVR